MSEPRIEDYAMIGDCQTAALIDRTGSIDWLCLPRFDSPACFAALLGNSAHGRFFVGPRGAATSRREYLPDTLILATVHETDEGAARVLDFMPLRREAFQLIRIVEGVRGRVSMRVELAPRFDYGSVLPWIDSEVPSGWRYRMLAGSDQLGLASAIDLDEHEGTLAADFTIAAGEQLAFQLGWSRSHERLAAPVDAQAAKVETQRWWRAWSGRCADGGPYVDAVHRSLITLKALTFAPTGGIVAAPTTSLPEHLGGVRNWDYRYCWLRDATFTLLALLDANYIEEARSWREWLLRATAGIPEQVHLMYGLAGERRLPEQELAWLPGFAGSQPVRVGNAAYEQFQLDVFGEVMDVMHQCWGRNLSPGLGGWKLERALVDFVESSWTAPDQGIWEVRGPRRHFTHSKMMAWVAVDRAIKTADDFGLEGPVDRWRLLRTRIHDDVCRGGFNAKRGSFVQFYGSDALDASLLMLPLVGFLPASDPRVVQTIESIQRELTVGGFVSRYVTDPDVDGLPEGEAAFLLCSFWLVDCLALLGRCDEARELFEHLLTARNDVGLLSESYDVQRGRLMGNFPQAFSHVGLVNSARILNLGKRASAVRA